MAAHRCQASLDSLPPHPEIGQTQADAVRNYGIPQRNTRDDAGDNEDTGAAASFCAFIGVIGGLMLCAVALLRLW